MLTRFFVKCLFALISLRTVVDGEVSTGDCILEALSYATNSDNPNLNANCNYPYPITTSSVISELRDKWIVFMGESTLRQMYLQFLGLFDGIDWDRIEDQKGNFKIEIRKTSNRFTFYYLPYYN